MKYSSKISLFTTKITIRNNVADTRVENKEAFFFKSLTQTRRCN